MHTWLNVFQADLSDSVTADKALTRRFPGIAERGEKHAHLAMKSRPRNLDQDAESDGFALSSMLARQATSDPGTGQGDPSIELPEYYHVGLFSYCQGRKGTINSCTEPAVSFSFNFWEVIQSRVPGSKERATDGAAFLTGNSRSSQDIIAIYISAFVVGFVACVLSVTRIFIPGTGLFQLFASTVCWPAFNFCYVC